MNFENHIRFFGRDITNIVHKQRQTTLDIRKNTQKTRNHSVAQHKQIKTTKAQNVQFQKIDILNEYLEDIMINMIKNQTKKLKTKNYTFNSSKIVSEKRALHIAWIIEIHNRYNFFPQTLYLAIKIFDQCLTQNISFQQELNGLTLASLHLAVKYQQTYNAPKIKDLIKIKKNIQKTIPEILSLEERIFETLDFNLSHNSRFLFLQCIAKQINLTKKNFALSQYLLEICFLQSSLLDYPEHEIALATVYLIIKARKIQTSKFEKLQKIFNLKEKELIKVARIILFAYEHIDNLPYFQIVKKKFQSKAFEEVALMNVQRKNNQSTS